MWMGSISWREVDIFLKSMGIYGVCGAPDAARRPWTVHPIWDAFPNALPAGASCDPTWSGSASPLTPRSFIRLWKLPKDARSCWWSGHPAWFNQPHPLPMQAKAGGAALAEINIERTPNSELMDMVLIGKAGEILPGLVEAWT